MLNLTAFWNSLFPPFASEPELKPGELSPGVIKPSYALAGVVAGYIIAHPDKLTVTRKPDEEPPKWDIGACAHLKRNQMVTRWADAKMTVEETEYTRYSSVQKSLTILFRGKPYDFDALERSLIQEALHKAQSLKEEKRLSDAAAARQQEACDLMEAVFAAPETVEIDAKSAGLVHEPCTSSCCHPGKERESDKESTRVARNPRRKVPAVVLADNPAAALDLLPDA